MLKKEQIPIFIADVMSEIAAGIDWFNDHNTRPRAGYPKEIDIQLNVEGPDGEYHQFWAKIPFFATEPPTVRPGADPRKVAAAASKN